VCESGTFLAYGTYVSMPDALFPDSYVDGRQKSYEMGYSRTFDF